MLETRCLLRMNRVFSNYLNLIIYFVLVHLSIESQIFRPRGVAISKLPLYNPDKDFTCFDGSLTIPFSHVNDDYCDCRDASDEPGTSACINGYFHCTNAGHRPEYIRSSLVNDGVCDCCDTSDEYNSTAECLNNCKELGKKSREEAVLKSELRRQGYEKKILMSQSGKQKKEEMKARIDELEKQKLQAESVKTEIEGKKTAAEELENAALEKYKTEEEELKKKKQEEEMTEYMAAEKKKATEMFHQLDTNKDGKLSYDELQTDLRLDQNGDGVVSEDEAKFFLHSKEYLELDEYTKTGWMIMKPLVTAEPTLNEEPVLPDDNESQPSDTTEVPEVALPTYDDHHDDVTEESYDDKDEDEEEEDESNKDEESNKEDEMNDYKFKPDQIAKRMKRRLRKNIPEEKKENESKYDDETQRLIDDATKARNELNEAERKVNDIVNEMNNLKGKIDRDCGPDDEFGAIQDDCFEYHNPEYVYKLCMFNKATQTSKGGGSETSLGNWGRWSGPDDDKHSKMIYEGGTSCWNGPARSTEVKLLCGNENKLTSVSEPSRCVYMFEFETPAICIKPSTQEDSAHDEL